MSLPAKSVHENPGSAYWLPGITGTRAAPSRAITGSEAALTSTWRDTGRAVMCENPS